MWRFYMCLVLVLFARARHCLDNGLALTPPMGWISTERFQCLVDCVNYPDQCISEKLIKSTADAMVTLGYRDAGYRYIVIGDCWMNKTRDEHGNIQPQPDRFPSGMKSLAKYIHDHGLLLGLQIDLSNSSCNKYPGSYGNYHRDAMTLVSWDVDYVKATACSFTNSDKIDPAYTSMGSTLNQTGRPIVYHCNWPVELVTHGRQVDYSLVSRTCNVYNTADPMVDSWESLEKTIKYSANVAKDVLNYTRPGSWNIPNPVLVGNFGLSFHEQTMQLAVWSIMNAPLLISADLRHARDYQRALLLHNGTLAIDQDVTYSSGIEVTVSGQVHIWRKPIRPAGSFALLFMYFNISGGPTRVSIILRDIGVHGAEQYRLTNIMTGDAIGVYHSWYTFNCEVDPVGALFIRAEALP